MSIPFESKTSLGKSEFNCQDSHAVLRKYSVTQYDLFDLAGGVGDEKDALFKCSIETASPDFANITIISSLHECYREINFKEHFITNSFIQVRKPGVGFGRKLFNSQLIAARKFKFEKITLQATGGGRNYEFNGHYTWGRFGFKMILESDIETFNELCSMNNRKEKTLYELLLTDEGRTLWIEKGFRWAGEFDVNEESSCSRNFQKYLDSKKY